MSHRVLKELFGSYPLREAGLDTGAVLQRPQVGDAAAAERVAREMKLGPVLRDLGAVAARELGMALEQENLRPVHSADDAKVLRVLAERIGRLLLARAGEFDSSASDHLRMRG